MAWTIQTIHELLLTVFSPIKWLKRQSDTEKQKMANSSNIAT